MIKIRLLILALVFAAWPGYADTLTGTVVKVADGDTVTVLIAEGEKVRVRLSGIDAPESKQPHGAAATRYLANLVAGEVVVVEYEKQDRYGRVIGVVMLNGQDVNYQIIKSGLAWHYKRYQNEQSRENRVLYSEGETAAKLAGLNLWEQPAPIPPWEWRKLH